jgi:hypothetical protein
MSVKRMVRVAALCVVALVTGAATAAAGEPADQPAQEAQIAALGQYEILALDEQTVHRPGVGALVLSGDDTFVGLYSRPLFRRDLLFDHPDAYHAVDLLYDGRDGRRQLVLLFKSESDRPVAGGWETFQAASVFGYEVVVRPRISLVVGGGLALSDFGIELEDGSVWPLITVPFVRATWRSELLEASFDFITGPNLGLTLAPERRTQLSADLRIDQFRDVRDLIFEVALSHRFLAVGIKNDTFGFVPGDPDVRSDETSPVAVHYLAAFGALDFGVLQLSGGYAFEGRQRYGESTTANWGDGYFLSVQAMLPLRGFR